MTVIFFIICYILSTCNSQETIFNASRSDPSGDYFISSTTSLLNDGEIICNSDTLCSVQCNDIGSCKNTIISCGDALNCNIKCIAVGATCQSSIIYISSIDTSITCHADASCKSLTIYTDYTNYPLSYTELSCSGSYYACQSIQIKDKTTQSIGYTNADQLKIFCVNADSGCTLDSTLSSNQHPLLSIPTTMNSTGAYYQDVGSFITLSCTNNNLCSIDCSNGGCKNSIINCGNSDICMIKCGGYGAQKCNEMNIIAKNSTTLTFDCPASEGVVCQDIIFDIMNVNSIDIDCSYFGGSFKCNGNTYNLQNAENINIKCGDEFCNNNKLNIDNVTNDIAISCISGCNNMYFSINSINYLDISCYQQGWNPPQSCKNMKIYATSTSDIYVNCQDSDDCPDLDICSEGGDVIIDCLG